MKKIISYALVAGVLSLGTMTQANAGYGHVSYLVDKANHLRAMHDSLNKQASEIEATIRYYQAHGGNPVYLKHKAMKLRKKAKKLAWKANYAAKHAFDHGYKRKSYGHHGYHSHHH